MEKWKEIHKHSWSVGKCIEWGKHHWEMEHIYAILKREGRRWFPLTAWMCGEAIVLACYGVHSGRWAVLLFPQVPGNRKWVKTAEEEEKLDMKNFLNFKNNEIWTRKAVCPWWWGARCWVQILTSLLPTPVTLGKLLNFLVCHLKKGGQREREKRGY